ncbi:EamA family transporter [Spirosoma utsteinense]|uniref:Drug/metabolite transporter (DMT)-like permease n=1 Tax=Spirosoma utsteinense TaxID=2585773 RepID=A0ABR6VZM1_9BACT|nr:EamA family transporter [Spirosoma utsteinense]MBC3784535.1 drug/metabolite transporter (DMT)-like permease [Spirosoma utsteinense]MBC3789714.1 drug/metabolite transporter (DMT)-like permease [Spirosoma utsteinense]
MQVATSPLTTAPNRVTLWSALTSVYFLWGSTYLFIHFMTERMPPLYMASLRYIIAGTLLYGYARLTGTPRATRTEWKSAGIVGILLLTVANGCLTLALQYIPTGVAALLGGLLPVFLLTLNWASFARKRPTNLALVGLVIGLTGIYFLVKPDKLQGTGGLHANLIGAGLVTFGNFAWAVGTLLAPRVSLPSGTISSGIQMLVGGFVLLAISLCVEPVTPWSILDAPTKAVGSMFYLVVFGSIIGFSSYAWLARNASPQLLSTYAFVNPVVAMLLGVTFAGELFSSQSLLGAVIALVGVILITLGRK